MGIAIPVLVLQELQFENHGGTYKGLFEYPVFKLSVKNFGDSPAFLKSYAVVLGTDELPDDPAYPEQPWNIDMHEVVDASSSYTLSEGRSAPRDKPDAKMLEVLVSKKNWPVVYGFVTYGDVFGSAIHTMKFSKIFFEIESDGTDPLTMDFGGPKYTGQKENAQSDPK